MSAITPMISSLFSSRQAEALIASSRNKKIKLNIIADLKAIEVTSKSAVIHVSGSGIDPKKVGKGNVVVIVMVVEGRSGYFKLSATSIQPVYGSNFDYDVPVSKETLRDENDKPLDLFPGTEYDVTLGYAVIKIDPNKTKTLKAIDVIAAMTFKTAPEKTEKDNSI